MHGARIVILVLGPGVVLGNTRSRVKSRKSTADSRKKDERKRHARKKSLWRATGKRVIPHYKSSRLERMPEVLAAVCGFAVTRCTVTIVLVGTLSERSLWKMYSVYTPGDRTEPKIQVLNSLFLVYFFLYFFFKSQITRDENRKPPNNEGVVSFVSTISE